MSVDGAGLKVENNQQVRNNTGKLRTSLDMGLAEAVRFELTDGFPSLVFKTSALNRSATLPEGSPEYHSSAHL